MVSMTTVIVYQHPTILITTTSTTVNTTIAAYRHSVVLVGAAAEHEVAAYQVAHLAAALCDRHNTRMIMTEGAKAFITTTETVLITTGSYPLSGQSDHQQHDQQQLQ